MYNNKKKNREGFEPSLIKINWNSKPALLTTQPSEYIILYILYINIHIHYKYAYLFL